MPETRAARCPSPSVVLHSALPLPWGGTGTCGAHLHTKRSYGFLQEGRGPACSHLHGTIPTALPEPMPLDAVQHCLAAVQHFLACVQLCTVYSARRHRNDLVHLKCGDMEEAQRWKLELEQLQRRDRKLRADAGVKQ